MNETLNNFEWLQNWYKSQCDGDWEHTYGIRIETVDNPGWYLVIDLIETEFENQIFNPVEFDNGTNWYYCLLRNNSFEGSCDPNNLSQILQIFRNWVEGLKKN